MGNETVSSEKISVKKLVSAGLDLLKAGKELKLNVDIKNPESIQRANEVSNLGHLMISEQKLTLLAKHNSRPLNCFGNRKINKSRVAT